MLSKLHLHIEDFLFVFSKCDTFRVNNHRLHRKCVWNFEMGSLKFENVPMNCKSKYTIINMLALSAFPITLKSFVSVSRFK